MMSWKDEPPVYHVDHVCPPGSRLVQTSVVGSIVHNLYPGKMDDGYMGSSGEVVVAYGGRGSVEGDALQRHRWLFSGFVGLLTQV